MDGHNMEYNSAKKLLTMPEYGRNVQLLVRHAKTIEDAEYRQAFVERIVDLMHQMHPQNRNVEDYRVKLWQHVFRIAEYDLEVQAPEDVDTTPEAMNKRPERVDYPKLDSNFRHYGSNVQKLIKKAKDMEPGPKRDGFVAVIGSYMKLAYRTWNKDHYVSDEVIRGDLEKLSKGELQLSENMSLDNLANSNQRRRGNNSSNHNNNRRGHNNQYNNNNGKGRGPYRPKRRK
ncbi:MAG: DUF4290 domain-containing protein [Bacteroidota bacterium]